MLARLALRLAAIEALCPSAGLAAGGPWPTIAGPRVYDSRLDPIAAAETAEALSSAVAGLEGKPVVIVYTEDDHILPFEGSRVPVRDYVVTLVIEMMVAAPAYIDVTTPSGATETRIGGVEAPLTDRQHEAVLDMLEAGVRFVLDRENHAPTAVLFRTVARETRQVTSDPQRAADRTLRLALRTLKYHVAVARDAWSRAPAAGLGGLPEPLRALALALPAGSSGAALCATLAGLLPAPVALPRLEGVDVTIDLGAGPDTRKFIANP
jgi:hypothetical protein